MCVVLAVECVVRQDKDGSHVMYVHMYILCTAQTLYAFLHNLLPQNWFRMRNVVRTCEHYLCVPMLFGG